MSEDDQSDALIREAEAVGLSVGYIEPFACQSDTEYTIQLLMPDGGIWAEGSHETADMVRAHIGGYVNRRPGVSVNDDRFAELDRIVQLHYETGEYAGCRLRVAPPVWEAMRTSRPSPSSRPLGIPTDPFASMMAIPVVPDETLADGQWWLIDAAGEVLRQGVVVGVAAAPGVEGDDFFEPDEPAEKVWAAFECGEKHQTRPPAGLGC